MLQVFSENLSTVVLDSTPTDVNIERLNEHIKLCNCQNMTVDISGMNIIDACMVSSVCSATHYLKYEKGKIKWIVNSPKVEEFTKSMNLGNSDFIVK